MTPEKWQSFPREKQILNIASEFSRTKFWLLKGEERQALNCLDRIFELLDLTINDPNWQKKGLREMLRLREVLSQFYIENKKDLNQFLKIFKTLLLFNKFTSSVEI